MSFLGLILAEFNWEEEHEIRGRFSQTRTAMLRSVENRYWSRARRSDAAMGRRFRWRGRQGGTPRHWTWPISGGKVGEV